MIIIRADGNAQIGAGHLMRCLTIAEMIAQAAQDRKAVCFFCADEGSAQIVAERGFKTTLLHTKPEDMESELSVWEDCMNREDTRPSVILADSYHVTDIYLRTLRRYGKVYLMDDLQDRAYPVDGVVNYHVFADRARYESLYADQKISLLLGAEYAPVGRQFSEGAYRVAEQVKNVLITTGGGDRENIAGAVLDSVRRDGQTYHVVVGRFNPHFDAWRRRAEEDRNVVVHHDVKDMAALMRECDLAVTAGGSTIYELAALGVPFICFSYAENQELLTEYIGENHVAAFAGAWHKDRDRLLTQMSYLYGRMCEDMRWREECSAEERKMTDGRGAERIARRLLEV